MLLKEYIHVVYEKLRTLGARYPEKHDLPSNNGFQGRFEKKYYPSLESFKT